MPDHANKRGKRLEDEFFHRKENELLVKMKARLRSDDVVNLELNCPKCEGVLHELKYEAIRIDTCDRCHGVWLDAGELAQIVYKDERGWLTRVLG